MELATYIFYGGMLTTNVLIFMGLVLGFRIHITRGK